MIERFSFQLRNEGAIALLLLFALAIALSTFFSPIAHADYQRLEKIVAVVEDGVILQSELDARILSLRKDLMQSSSPIPPDDIFREKVLEQLIIEKIQIQLAEKNGMHVSDSALTETMEKIAAQNGKSLNEFKQVVESDGIVYKELREQIRTNLLLSRIRQRMVSNRINITEQDVENYLNSAEGQEKLSSSFHFLHVLVSDKNKADELYLKLNKGADFQTTANNYGAVTDLGKRKLEQLPSLFVDVAKTMEINQIAKPIESPSGYHIIKLIEKQGGDHKIVKQTLVRHILIKPNEIRSKDDALHLIQDIRQQIVDGKKFEDMARTYSEDAVSANDGGELGWTGDGDFVPEFETVMNATEKGQLSEPFYSVFGWHILEVTDRREHNIGKEFQLDQARSILQQQQFETEIQLWLREIRQDAYVEIKTENSGLPSEQKP